MKNKFLKIANRKAMYRVPYSEIIHFRSKGMSTVAHTVKGEEYVCSKNLGAICKDINGSEIFFRVHASHVVNVNKITKYKKGKGSAVYLVNGTVVPVARRRKSGFLNKYIG